ncbi:hypothetical protein HELRODRAFT_168192 [Helobdella robusta]|uniref:Fibronectin type-III domain-containing protein n=1 Tax=Helobdella robusta TaxID=6412 RepID=T1F0A1_HELRO|nr:hypothetical protein HELRODRAFT_168192 [Helobdella robusta]ESO09230.1 hypothetical protein HELRODRAFT_168192 [Helobdella robusta]
MPPPFIGFTNLKNVNADLRLPPPSDLAVYKTRLGLNITWSFNDQSKSLISHLTICYRSSGAWSKLASTFNSNQFFFLWTEYAKSATYQFLAYAHSVNGKVSNVSNIVTFDAAGAYVVFLPLLSYIFWVVEMIELLNKESLEGRKKEQHSVSSSNFFTYTMYTMMAGVLCVVGLSLVIFIMLLSTHRKKKRRRKQNRYGRLYNKLCDSSSNIICFKIYSRDTTDCFTEL